jgi:hypothetical protein
VILVEEGSNHAFALDSVTLTSHPFHFTNPNNFSGDQRTRLSVLVANIDLLPGDQASIVTAQAKDAQNNTFVLPVEAVVKVPSFNWLTQVIVRLPDQLASLNQVTVTVTCRGQTSNAAIVQIVP